MLIWAPCLVVSICVIFISALCLSQGDQDQAQSDEKEAPRSESHEDAPEEEKVGKLLIWVPCWVVCICLVFISILCLS